MRLYELIVRSAESGLKMQNPDGSMPAGHNGPYSDPETPVRNTAHWLITFSKTHKITGEEKYLEAVKKAGDYLIADEQRPEYGAFFCRNNPEKDFSNGLIGQAWVFEALAEASRSLKNSTYAEEAINVFYQHEFDFKKGLWRILHVDGSIGEFDITLNHQIWFAASASELIEFDKKVAKKIKTFMNSFPRFAGIHSNGRIVHGIPFPVIFGNFRGFLKAVKRSVSMNSDQRFFEKDREIGYHAFNLYALAILARHFPNHYIWKKHRVNNALMYINSPEYLDNINESRFGFPYNPPGFECAYAIYTFRTRYKDWETSMNNWVWAQIENTYDVVSGAMNLKSPDINTSTARIYEAARLPDLELGT